MFRHLLNMVYPKICLLCGIQLNRSELEICVICQHQLPQTSDFHFKENEITQSLQGRVSICRSFSFLEFQKKGKVQKLFHQLKYKGNKEIGYLLGRLFALELEKQNLTPPTWIVPVPLHSDKLKRRGYNQSEEICKGIAHVFNTEVMPHVLERTEDLPTLTKKNRYQRAQIIQQQFRLNPNIKIPPMLHIWVVDDVFTTGATMEACLRCFSDYPRVFLRAMTLARVK